MSIDHVPTDRVPDTDTEVVVVGAGPTGLTAAVLLAHDGVRVRVLDRTSQPATESRALVVQARTVELWHKLGLAERAIAGGTLLRGARALLDGRDLAHGGLVLDIAGHGAGQTPYPEVLVFAQDQTERMLLDVLAEHGVTVERDTEVLDLHDHDDHVELRTRHADAEDTVTARYVIGADGAHSMVRRGIGASFDGAAHDGAFFLADTGVDWDRGYGDALTVALDSGGGMTLFVPMRDPGGDRRRFRVFGSLHRDLPAGSSITLDEVQRRLDERTGLVTRLHDPRWIATYRLSSRMTDVFGRGRVFLAGDAAHIHTPTGGQGMNTGIQDAFNLSWKISAVLHGHARPALLDSYQAERQPVARALLAGTDAAFAVISANGRVTRILRPVVAALLPTLLRRPAVGRRAFRTLSQITIGYPDSAVVAGDPVPGAGPGDRAPHAPLRAGGTVFDLLTGTGHHLLLFPVTGTDPVAAQHVAEHVAEQARLPIRVHLLDPDKREAYRAYRIQRATMVLVRPDGHIAWRGDLHDTAGLAEYLTRWYLTTEPASVPAAATPLPAPGHYRIDPARSTLALTVEHWFGRGTVHATLPLTEATLTLTGDPTTAHAHAVADAAGFTSGHTRRDTTVISRRLLDTATWPTVTYTGDGLRWTGDGWELSGVLTAHGHSHYLALTASAITTAAGGHLVRGRARLDRHDLGIAGLPGIIGRTVTLDLTLHATPDMVHTPQARAAATAQPGGRG